MSTSLILDQAELEQLTGYRRACDQVRELQRQGFHRARRNRLGDVVLERAHYDAVCAGRQAPAGQDALPPVRLLMKRAA